MSLVAVFHGASFCDLLIMSIAYRRGEGGGGLFIYGVGLRSGSVFVRSLWMIDGSLVWCGVSMMIGRGIMM